MDGVWRRARTTAHSEGEDTSQTSPTLKLLSAEAVKTNQPRFIESMKTNVLHCLISNPEHLPNLAAPSQGQPWHRDHMEEPLSRRCYCLKRPGQGLLGTGEGQKARCCIHRSMQAPTSPAIHQTSHRRAHHRVEDTAGGLPPTDPTCWTGDRSALLGPSHH